MKFEIISIIVVIVLNEKLKIFGRVEIKEVNGMRGILPIWRRMNCYWSIIWLVSRWKIEVPSHRFRQEFKFEYIPVALTCESLFETK